MKLLMKGDKKKRLSGTQPITFTFLPIPSKVYSFYQFQYPFFFEPIIIFIIFS